MQGELIEVKVTLVKVTLFIRLLCRLCVLSDEGCSPHPGTGEEGPLWLALRQKRGEKRFLAATVSQLPSDPNNQHTNLRTSGWHILIPFNSKEMFITFYPMNQEKKSPRICSHNVALIWVYRAIPYYL